ncbi:MAG: endo-1,4-beta-xylanase, partial [Oscillospiraceae bacterium]|nr:endo-1,4-beta-xylanase [Oscillospiraceae bacterium]
MLKRLLLICMAILLLSAPLALIPAVAAGEGEKELYNFTFDSEAAHGAYFAAGNAHSIEWLSGPGVGYGDDNALKVTHTEGMTYNSAENAVRLTLPEPLPGGGVYRIVARVYAALDENPDKDTLTGPGFVINEDYPGAQGVSKFPPNFGTLPFDEWKEIDVTLPMHEAPINTLDFRIVINDAPKHPDVWYWDNIEIYQVGDLEDVTVPEWDLTLAPMHEEFGDYFLFGNIMDPHHLADPQNAEMFERYYNALTGENCMKPIQLAPEKDNYVFGGADRLVDWGLEKGMFVHGHALVWHAQSPQWLNMDSDEKPLTRAEAKANMESFVSAVGGHFSGRVGSWDVVNEAFTSSVPENFTDWRDCLRRDSPWYRAYANGADADEHPADYIYDAFVFARLADPVATLFYLDFNEEEAGKREAMAQMTEELNEQWKSDPRNTQPDRLLIDGLGLQAHYWADNIKASDVEATIQRFIRTGARLSISELDIPLGSYGTFQTRTEPPTESELQHQAELYRQLFDVFIKYADSIERVTVWGLADSMSWRGTGHPVLFNVRLAPKPAFWSVMEAAANLSATVPEPTPPPAATPTTP